MSNARAILCGSASAGSLPFPDPKPLRLRRWGKAPNVHLTIEDISRAMYKEVPAAFLDLLDIATYVYCADQAITRGGSGAQDFGDNWRRRLFFRIPVRDVATWQADNLKRLLVATLSFLSEDEYHFDFCDLKDAPPFQAYLNLGSEVLGGPIEEIVMFSGGLDSLGGAIQEALIDKRRVVLVNHRSTQKLTRRHRELVRLIESKAQGARPIHVPVRINKAKNLNHEYTQRSRSFLYASLGATIAQMLGLSRLRFYENGIVSLNLPPSAQVVGARATRTTHPQVINALSRLLSQIAGRTFVVENPFLWKTKTDVVRVIADAGCSDLVRLATSCTHTWEITRLHTHCGTCSQCIDRRFAVLAAGVADADPAEAYKVDLLSGAREQGDPRTMITAFAETAREITKLDAIGFFTRFGEASRVLRHIDGNPDATALRVFDLHQRHARQVTQVIADGIKQYSAEILDRSLPPTCLLRLTCDASAAHGGTAVSSVTGAQRAGCPKGNYIIRKGECWAIRFGANEEKLYTPDIGFDYLQALFENPGSTVSASEIDCIIRRRTKDVRLRLAQLSDLTSGDSGTVDSIDAGAVLDAEARQSLMTRRAEIQERIDAARDSDDPASVDEVDELENERQWIDDELRKAKGLSGRARKLGDERNKVRNRVCNAIRRALKKIDQFDRPLAEHLAKPVLNLGHSINYTPRDGVQWSSCDARSQ